MPEGSLRPPGPLGRAVRLTLGIACFWVLYDLFLYHRTIIETPVSVLPNIFVCALVAMLVVNYVVNIGFGKNWGRWPGYASAMIILYFATTAWLAFGTPDHPMMGLPLWAWLVYFYGHLGTSFVVSAILATPGCEMRAIPHLLGKITGRPATQHVCPSGLLAKLDNWESRKQA